MAEPSSATRGVQDVADPKVLRLKDVDPQHMQVRVTDVIEGSDQGSVIMTIYTGTLLVQHGAGEDRHDLRVQVPLIALVQNPLPNVFPGTKAIFTFDHEHFEQQFRGAVATASIAAFLIKDDDAVVAVDSAKADLREVELEDRNNTVVHAVVLELELASEESEVIRVAYYATVLSLVNEDLKQRTVREGDNGWTGRFNRIGNIVEVHGVPHPQ
jgi:hypothetical protein